MKTRQPLIFQKVKMNMDNEEKKKWLWRYRDSLDAEKALKDDLEEQNNRARSITSILTDMPGGKSDGQKLARAVESIICAQQKLQAQINLCGAIRREVTSVIDQITDERSHTILYRRYILGQKWEVIAYEMHLDYTTVWKRHRESLKKLAIEIKV